MKLEDYYDPKTGTFDCKKIVRLSATLADAYLDILLDNGLDEKYEEQLDAWKKQAEAYQSQLTMLRDTRAQLEKRVASREKEIIRRFVEVYKH